MYGAGNELYISIITHLFDISEYNRDEILRDEKQQLLALHALVKATMHAFVKAAVCCLFAQSRAYI